MAIFQKFVENLCWGDTPFIQQLENDDDKSSGSQSKEVLKAISTLQGNLVSGPVLSFHRSKTDFTVIMDTHDVQTGSVLMPEEAGKNEMQHWNKQRRLTHKSETKTHDSGTI